MHKVIKIIHEPNINITDNNANIADVKKINVFDQPHINPNIIKGIIKIIPNTINIRTTILHNKLYLFINEGNIYQCLVEELLFIVLHKKQPVYEEELKVEVFEDVLNDTSISSVDLQEYLSLKLREGINYD